MKHQLWIGSVFVVLAVFAALALSQEKAKAPDVKALIEKLGDPDFAVRQDAAQKILDLGEKAIPALEEAAKNHADVHVRYEAERLLHSLKRKESPLQEKPLARPPGADRFQGQLREMERRFDKLLERLTEHGLLGSDELDRLRKALPPSPGAGLSVKGSVKGMVDDGRERMEYERDADGRVKVKITKDGESKSFEAESLEALKKQAPDVYEKVKPYLEGVRMRFGDWWGNWPDPFDLRDRMLRPGLPTWPLPLHPRDLRRPREESEAPGGFRLGVWVGEIGEALRAHLELGQNEGVLVEEIVPGSLAERMGIQRLDVIRTANGVRVGSAADIRKALAGVKAGEKIELGVIRKGKALKLSTTR